MKNLFDYYKRVIRTILYSLRNESLSTLFKNAIKFSPGSSHPSKLVRTDFLSCQIEYVYRTPCRLRIKGWLWAKEDVVNVFLSLKDELIPLHYPLLRPDISERYQVPMLCGYDATYSHSSISIESFRSAVLIVNFGKGKAENIPYNLASLIEESLFTPSKKGVKNAEYKTPVSKSLYKKGGSIDILIPFKDEVHLLLDLIASIILHSGDIIIYSIILINNSSSKETNAIVEKELLAKHDFIKQVSFAEPFNYSRMINLGIISSSAPYLLLLNNDMLVLTQGWLNKLLSRFTDPRVSVVGCKLLYPDETIQHAGVVLSDRVLTRHVWRDYPNDLPKDHHVNSVRKTSAVTGACMMVRRADLEKYGDFDDKLGVTLNDIDYCLRLATNEQLVLYEPSVKLTHHESYSRGEHDIFENWERTEKEVRYFRKKWKAWLRNGDPYA